MSASGKPSLPQRVSQGKGSWREVQEVIWDLDFCFYWVRRGLCGVWSRELAWSDFSKGSPGCYSVERMEDDTGRSREGITQSRREMMVCTRQQWWERGLWEMVGFGVHFEEKVFRTHWWSGCAWEGKAKGDSSVLDWATGEAELQVCRQDYKFDFGLVTVEMPFGSPRV